ncbi:MAG: hypothetical protein HY819_11425 [Acidobacteria bacterium]|nr:hypothetical protein [Acidobacteriota bacterium]
MKNSQDFATKFYSLTFSLKLRSAFIRLSAFALTIAIFFINMSWTDVSETSFFSRMASTVAATLIIPGLFMVMSSPLTSMAISSLYLKARQTKSGNHSGTAEEAEISQKTLFTTKRKIFTGIALALSLLTSNIAYGLMVPSSTKVIAAPRVQIEKIADSENAWVQYDLAIRDLLELPMLSKSMGKKLYEVVGDATVKQMTNPIYGSLEKYAFGLEELTDKQIEYINKHENAIEHLLVGAKLSKAQYYTGTPNISTPVPNLLQMRALANLAAAKARYLQKQGKVQEAVELALANYKMATDIGSETNGSLISGLISVVCRNIAAKSLLTLIHSGATTAEMDKEIARFVAEQDSRMLNVYQFISSERQATLVSFEDALIKQNYNSDTIDTDDLFFNNSTALKELIKSSPGLRTRIYTKYYELSQETLNLMRESTENWDFVQAEKVGKEILTQADPWNWNWSPADFIATALFYVGVPNASASMKSLYTDNTMGKTVTTFAACSAYKKNHNGFPSDLALAMTEVGLSIPQDLTTNKAIGYRLENGNPVVWFAGIDGMNDGGTQAYESVKRHIASPGKDFIFSYGQLPFQQ